ncbi:MAG: D-sedoheptulose 7-phosphate isomerase [Cyclobacteriaceae bacterium]|nr:D-sedoheptulose 7-phosphate isomerase [Cyclobacteriaceae bacterium]
MNVSEHSNAHDTWIKSQLEEAGNLLNQVLSDSSFRAAISQGAEVIAHCIKNNGKILSCGNGGSLCDAMHFAEELTGRFRENRRPLPAFSISDPAHMSCVANDFHFNDVFARVVDSLGNQGDVLLAISTSGNSENVYQAAFKAREKGMKIIGFTGKDGGKLSTLTDVEIRVPHFGYSDRIQEIHIKAIHIMISIVEKLVI